MTRQDAQNGIDILTSLRKAGQGSQSYIALCQHFHGWAMAHDEVLVNLAAAALGMPPAAFPPQQMRTLPDVDVRGTAPRETEGLA